jgi:hypothetical protein
MSKELNDYLNSMDIRVLKLVDGSTIIGKVLDYDDYNMMIEKPQQIGLHDEGLKVDLIMNQYMYGSDDSAVVFNVNKIIASSDASFSLKKFYSKHMLREKVTTLVESTADKKKNKPSDLYNMFETLLNGLEQQGYRDTRDDDFYKRRFNFPDDFS